MKYYYLLLLFLFIVCISIPLFLISREGNRNKGPPPYTGPPASELTRIDDEIWVIVNDKYVEITIDYLKQLNGRVPMLDDIWRYSELAREFQLRNWYEVIKKYGRILSVSERKIPYIKNTIVYYRNNSSNLTVTDLAMSLDRMNNRINATLEPLKSKLDGIARRSIPPPDYSWEIDKYKSRIAWYTKNASQKEADLLQPLLDKLLKEEKDYNKLMGPNPEEQKLKDLKDKEAYGPRLELLNRILSPIQEAIDKGLIIPLDYRPIFVPYTSTNEENSLVKAKKIKNAVNNDFKR
jgi:hypothetical protein